MAETDAPLEDVIAACKKELETGSGTRKQGDAPPGWAVIATHVDDVPGVATSELMIEYILGAIRVVYAYECSPWKKVLGFKVSVDDTQFVGCNNFEFRNNLSGVTLRKHQRLDVLVAPPLDSNRVLVEMKRNVLGKRIDAP